MFSAKFITSKNGTSQKTGNAWYRITLLVTELDNTQSVLNEFCTENAYNNSLGLSNLQDVKVACGVKNGHITINALKGE